MHFSTAARNRRSRQYYQQKDFTTIDSAEATSGIKTTEESTLITGKGGLVATTEIMRMTGGIMARGTDLREGIMSMEEEIMSQANTIMLGHLIKFWRSWWLGLKLIHQGHHSSFHRRYTLPITEVYSYLLYI